MTECPMPIRQNESPRKISARQNCLHHTGRKRDKDFERNRSFMEWTKSTSTSWNYFRALLPREYDKEQIFVLTGKLFSEMPGLGNRSEEFCQSSIGTGTS